MYTSRFPAANVTRSGVPVLPSEPRSRLFDGSVNPLFNSVLVWPSIVTRQNVFSDRGTLGVSVTLCVAAVVNRRAQADVVPAARAEDAIGSGRVHEVTVVGQILCPARNQRLAEAEDDRGDRLAVRNQLLGDQPGRNQVDRRSGGGGGGGGRAAR